MANHEALQSQTSEKGPVPGEVLEEAYRAYKPALVEYAKVLKSRYPEDVVQEVFVKAATTESYTEQGMIRAWLYRLTHNAVMDEHRSASRLPTTPSSDMHVYQQIPETSAPERFGRVEYNAISPELTDFLVEAIGEDRTETLLLEACGIPQEEIASIRGITHATVRTQLHRGRKGVIAQEGRLREILLGA